MREFNNTIFDYKVVKDIEAINEKIMNEKDTEKLVNLRMQRLFRGIELNNGIANRPFRAYFPY